MDAVTKQRRPWKSGPDTMTIVEAGARLGVGRNGAYEAAKRGEIPTIRIGKRLLVPRIAFDRMLDSTAEMPSQRQQAIQEERRRTAEALRQARIAKLKAELAALEEQ